MEELKKAVSLTKDSAMNEDVFTAIIASLECEAEKRDERVKFVLESDVISRVKTVLTSVPQCHQVAVRLIAELVKTEEARLHCTSVGLVAPLVDIMSSGNNDEVVQACRALGNMCFDNDGARCEVYETGGVERLAKLLTAQLAAEPDSPKTLPRVACGFLFNLVNTHESLIDSALSTGVIEILKDYLVKFRTDEDVILMVLLAVGSLADSEVGRKKVAECGMVTEIVRLLADTGIGAELQETVLDLLASLCDADDLKLVLSEPDLFKTLLTVMERCETNAGDDEQTTLMNLTADLIVLLLTGDESMMRLYDGGNGQVLSVVTRWLTSDSEHLQNSAALAIGNMARSDEHCIQLVESDFAGKLLRLFERNPVDTGSPVTHHAVLSALRNLAIPAVNKPVLLQQSLLEKILPFAVSPMSTVVFKLLGTLRMAIDGQSSAAVRLGTDKAFMLKLADWCKTEDHEGVRGEANRLVASLIKNSSLCKDVMLMVARCGALPHLVHMTAAEHLVMQNEAIVALTILVTILTDLVADQLSEADIVGRLKQLLSAGGAVVELLHNSLMLVKSLSTTGSLRQQMKDAGFVQLLTDLRNHGDATVNTVAAAISLQ